MYYSLRIGFSFHETIAMPVIWKLTLQVKQIE